jgi:hypothetical protein
LASYHLDEMHTTPRSRNSRSTKRETLPRSRRPAYQPRTAWVFGDHRSPGHPDLGHAVSPSLRPVPFIPPHLGAPSSAVRDSGLFVHAGNIVLGIGVRHLLVLHPNSITDRRLPSASNRSRSGRHVRHGCDCLGCALIPEVLGIPTVAFLLLLRVAV